MVTYLVERYLPGMSPEEFIASEARARGATARMRREGTAIRYLGSTFVPEDETCFCVFESAGVEAVQDASERARFPFARILECRHRAGDGPVAEEAQRSQR